MSIPASKIMDSGYKPSTAIVPVKTTGGIKEIEIDYSMPLMHLIDMDPSIQGITIRTDEGLNFCYKKNHGSWEWYSVQLEQNREVKVAEISKLPIVKKESTI